MTCSNCNTCGKDPCSCGGCKPAKYGCDFNIMANPYDASIWNVTINGATKRVKIPKINETDIPLIPSNTNSNVYFYIAGLRLEEGYIASDDDVFSIISKLERDEILEEVFKNYLND